MLTTNDIDFLIMTMDKGKYEGIQTCLKVGEVFLKLQEMKNEQARVDGPDIRDADDAQEEVVPE